LHVQGFAACRFPRHMRCLSAHHARLCTPLRLGTASDSASPWNCRLGQWSRRIGSRAREIERIGAIYQVDSGIPTG